MVHLLLYWFVSYWFPVFPRARFSVLYRGTSTKKHVVGSLTELYMSSPPPPVFSEVHVAWSLILSIAFCKSLFVPFSFFCWSYFHLRLLFIHFFQIIYEKKDVITYTMKIGLFVFILVYFFFLKHYSTDQDIIPTFLSLIRTWISNTIEYGLLFSMYCWYWWNCSTSLFKRSFGFGLWSSTALSTIFHLCRGGQFYWRRKAPTYWQTWSHNVVSSTLRHEWGSNSQL